MGSEMCIRDRVIARELQWEISYSSGIAHTRSFMRIFTMHDDFFLPACTAGTCAGILVMVGFTRGICAFFFSQRYLSGCCWRCARKKELCLVAGVQQFWREVMRPTNCDAPGVEYGKRCGCSNC